MYYRQQQFLRFFLSPSLLNCLLTVIIATQFHAFTCAFFFFNSAPSVSPGELRVSYHLPTTTAELSWTPVPKEKQNGVITGYTVQVVGANSTLIRQIPVDKDSTSVKITWLNPFKKYMFRVSAKTKAGSGPPAETPSKGETGDWF